MHLVPLERNPVLVHVGAERANPMFVPVQALISQLQLYSTVTLSTHALTDLVEYTDDIPRCTIISSLPNFRDPYSPSIGGV